MQRTALGFCMVWCVYSIEQVLVWDSFNTLARSVTVSDRAKVLKNIVHIVGLE
jgi:hypothetical protein